MKVRVALLTGAAAMAGAALLALAPAPASAQSTGPYVGIGGGAPWACDGGVHGPGHTHSMGFEHRYTAPLKGGFAHGDRPRPARGHRNGKAAGKGRVGKYVVMQGGA